MITEAIVCYYHAMYYTDVSRSYVSVNLEAKKSVSALMKVRKPFGIGIAVLMSVNVVLIVVLFTIGATKSFSANVTHTFTNLLLLGLVIFKMERGIKCTKLIEQFANPSKEMKRAMTKIKMVTLSCTIPLLIIIPFQLLVFIFDWNTIPSTALIFPAVRSSLITICCTVNVLSIEPINKRLLEKNRFCFGLLISPFSMSKFSSNGSKSKPNSKNSVMIHSRDSSITTTNNTQNQLSQQTQSQDETSGQIQIFAVDYPSTDYPSTDYSVKEKEESIELPML
jgi:hypothetical protein